MHVVAIEFLELDAPEIVYDLTIPEEESFLLANGVIAHNSDICLARHGLRYTADSHEPVGHEIPYLSGVPYHPS